MSQPRLTSQVFSTFLLAELRGRAQDVSLEKPTPQGQERGVAEGCPLAPSPLWACSHLPPSPSSLPARAWSVSSFWGRPARNPPFPGGFRLIPGWVSPEAAFCDHVYLSQSAIDLRICGVPLWEFGGDSFAVQIMATSKFFKNHLLHCLFITADLSITSPLFYGGINGISKKPNDLSLIPLFKSGRTRILS